MRLYGPNLVANGGFDADADWSKGPSWSIADGAAKYQGEAGGEDFLWQSLPIEYGHVYEVRFSISDYHGDGVGIFFSLGGGGRARGPYVGDQVVREIVAAGPVQMFVIEADEGALSFNVDDVSVRKVLVRYDIYRGQDGRINYETPVATMWPGQEVVEIADQDLPANTTWHYVRRAVRLCCCGKESDDSHACIVRIASDGQSIGPSPNPPTDILAEPIAGGAIRLRWRYEPGGQAVAPETFSISLDTLDNEVGVVPAGFAIGGVYVWLSEPFEHGRLVRLCVRSAGRDGARSSNTYFVSAVADAQGPEAIHGLLVEVDDVEV